jgi:hypothetical protein
MTSPLRKRPRIGDVIEIPTPLGLAYAQFTHKHTDRPRFGPLLRVFSGFHTARPYFFATLVLGPVQFPTFYPLGAACNRGYVSIVSNEDIPPEARLLPTFKSRSIGAKGEVGDWWLWDGTNSRRVGKLTEAMRSMPIRGVWNHAMLVNRIAAGWKPEHVT